MASMTTRRPTDEEQRRADRIIEQFIDDGSVTVIQLSTRPSKAQIDAVKYRPTHHGT